VGCGYYSLAIRDEKTLDNLTVIEYAEMMSGQICGKMFSDRGAEVTKIEAPHHVRWSDRLTVSFETLRGNQRRDEKSFVFRIRLQHADEAHQSTRKFSFGLVHGIYQRPSPDF
jgi:crotonobetainyl-CoA:carnitine CoA-transferase CaiB-like acyl-CoA transferase